MLRLRLILVLFALVLAGLGATTTQAATKRHHHHHHHHHDRPAGKQVVRYARRFLGIRYSWGGISPRTGFDCSGLVSFVYRHFGVSLPHYTGGQLYTGRHVSRRRLRPGDLLFFGLGHVGLYVGHARFIHAPHTGARVRIERLRRWDVTDARRIV
jgi:cell wall-associated NlpC family hydrolase